MNAGETFEAARVNAEQLVAEGCRYAVEAAEAGDEREADRWFSVARAADVTCDGIRMLRAAVEALQAGVGS